MKAGILIGIGVGLGVLALAAGSGTSTKRGDEKITGLPTTKRVTYVLPNKGQVNTQYFQFGPAIALVDGQPFDSNDIERAKIFQSEVRKVWALRKTALPPDADKLNIDEYSKELYYVPGWLWSGNELHSANDMTMQGTGVPVDEFGRAKPGTYGSADNSLWGSTLGGLLKNPLFKTVAIAALIASGPEGVAVYGAYVMWETRGKDLSAKDTLLAAGRAYVVSQCGPPCGVAFDFGVGVASGKSYDTAAEDALLIEMTPEQKVYYQQGKETVHKLGL